jgi:hypothetical protein
VHCAASGPLGGRHPAYVNSYLPSPRGSNSSSTSQSGATAAGCSRTAGAIATGSAAATCSASGSYSGAFGSLTGGSSDQGYSASGAAGYGCGGGSSSGSKAAVSPRLCYSGLSPRGGKG